ncbi:ribonuclease H-like domain-containing protein [Scheffersomyces xylosifermentans]|uniref:ribonuclease H-like domain-containing protein n=1 Tax=Scheffersomyces xylosifermentans TaxID=1304137 RepID=UPI00315DB7D8
MIDSLTGVYKKTFEEARSEALVHEKKIYLQSNTPEEYQKKIEEFVSSKRDPKLFLPKDVPNPPALLGDRKKYVMALADAYKKKSPEMQTPLLHAIDEEYQIASSSSSGTYLASIKKAVYYALHPEKKKAEAPKTATREQYMKALKELVIPKEKLEKYGFVMSPPEDINPNKSRKCHRCDADFRIEEQMNEVECQFHSGKIRRKDKGVRYYECCQEIVGGGDTQPCSKAKHHVFYWQNKEEMHWSIPFQRTSKLYGTREDSLFAIGIDCEMGYTTRGSELLRVTAVDFFSGEDVLDIFVRPFGKVVDLNTRYSGVSEIREDAVSFYDMLSQLGDIIDENTILVGHGLENDMNAMRLIHEKIIDTSILYPKHKTSPTFKCSLKDLAFQYLSRNIQIGEHDSSEDSLAANDIVKYFINQDLKRGNV